jgi:hypothetical protein
MCKLPSPHFPCFTFYGKVFRRDSGQADAFAWRAVFGLSGNLPGGAPLLDLRERGQGAPERTPLEHFESPHSWISGNTRFVTPGELAQIVHLFVGRGDFTCWPDLMQLYNVSGRQLGEP